MFASKQTVASILKPISAVVERLEQHIESQRAVIAKNDAAISDALDANMEATKEIAAAAQAADKFKTLLGVQ